MATDRQIAANRANAKKSPGPKTALGKLRSSRNAYRHGLSGMLPQDAWTLAKISEIARAVAKDPNYGFQQAAAFARAQLTLERIRKVRAALLETVPGGLDVHQALRRLGPLDRYERRALTKRSRSKGELKKP